MPPLNRTYILIVCAATQVAALGFAQQKRAPLPPLTADRAALIAVRVSPSVHFARASKEQADQAVDLNAALFAPDLDLTASYTRLSPITYPPFNIGNQTIQSPFPVILNNYLLRATVTLPVTDYFFKILPTYKAVDRNSDVAQYQTQTESERVALRAREAFYNYVRAEASIKVAKDSVIQLEAYVNDLNALFDAGNVTRADSMQAQAQLSDAKAQLALAEGNVNVTKDALRRLLDLGPSETVTIGEDVFAVTAETPGTKQDILRRALKERPELKGLRALAKVRDSSMQAENARRLPNLSVVGNLDYANPNSRYIPLTQEFRATWDISAVLRWSPNDFVLGKVNVEQAELELKRARSDLKQLEDSIVVEASQASSDYIAAERTIQAAKDGVKAAAEAWRVRRDLFRAGEATASEVLESEIVLRRAQLLHIDAHIALKLAKARIQHVIGTSTPTSPNKRTS